MNYIRLLTKGSGREVFLTNTPGLTVDWVKAHEMESACFKEHK